MFVHLCVFVRLCVCRYRGCAGIFDEPDLKLDVPAQSSTAINPSSTSVSEDSSSRVHNTPTSEGTSPLSHNPPAVQKASSESASSQGKVKSSSGPHCFFQLTCGPDLCVSGSCSGRREAKELGAQMLLQVNRQSFSDASTWSHFGTNNHV